MECNLNKLIDGKMKLEPIFNPHARIKQQTKKSKAEEKLELIE